MATTLGEIWCYPIFEGRERPRIASRAWFSAYFWPVGVGNLRGRANTLPLMVRQACPELAEGLTMSGLGLESPLILSLSKDEAVEQCTS